VEVIVNSLTVSIIIFVIIFGGALLGMLLRTALPPHHLRDESRDVVKLGIGLVGTMSALVLGLLVSSAKSSYDAQSTELTQMSANVIFLDRVLAHYGAETQKQRELLRKAVVGIHDQMWSEDSIGPSGLDPTAIGAEGLYEEIQNLSPRDDLQRSLRSQALSMAVTFGQMRWLMYEQGATSVSKPLLIVMVFWLAITFSIWGLLAPPNGTLLAALFVSALSVSGAIFLILEMYTPYQGLIRISDAPLRAALAHLGR
jgi:hypothetical protein